MCELLPGLLCSCVVARQLLLLLLLLLLCGACTGAPVFLGSRWTIRRCTSTASILADRSRIFWCHVLGCSPHFHAVLLLLLWLL